VLGERSAEEIKDIGQCLVEAHRRAVEAGVQGFTLPEGGFLFLAEADVVETIKVLGDVLKIGEWKCGTAKPDLTVGYPDDPTMEQAKSALVGGLNQLEFNVLKAQGAKPPMASMAVQQLGIGSTEGSTVCAKALNELGKQSLRWQSDSVPAATWRFEFYLRSVGIDEAAALGFALYIHCIYYPRPHAA
jgi:hypothetical protein